MPTTGPLIWAAYRCRFISSSNRPVDSQRSRNLIAMGGQRLDSLPIKVRDPHFRSFTEWQSDLTASERAACHLLCFETELFSSETRAAPPGVALVAVLSTISRALSAFP